MNPRTILTLANGKGIDLLNPRVEDIDFTAFAEHLAKEPRYNGATPGVIYSVAQHLCVGTDAMEAAGATEAECAAFLLHDGKEALWKDDPTPKKVAIAIRIAERCGVLADDILQILEEIEDDIDAPLHQAAGLPWPLDPAVAKVVKFYDLVMFVTEWRDLMHGIPHPAWGPYAHLTPLSIKIEAWPYDTARIGWLRRAQHYFPALRARPIQPQPGEDA